jgi:hypothetical protein
MESIQCPVPNCTGQVTFTQKETWENPTGKCPRCGNTITVVYHVLDGKVDYIALQLAEEEEA